MPFAVEAVSVTKKFGRLFNFLPFSAKKETVACNQVDLQVKKGELFCLLGPNGAGKTTLIKMFCTLILPDSGKAIINGYDIYNDTAMVKQSVGLVTSEERSFYWRLTGRENLEFFGALSNLSVKETKGKIKELSSLLEAEDCLDKLVQDCSSGLKQRLGVIRGLLNDPEILFLDEPTHSLDPLHSKSLMRFMKDEFSGVKGNTVFFCTHQLKEAEDFADRVAIMHKGMIVGCFEMAQLRQEGKNLEQIFLHCTQEDHAQKA